MSMQRVTQRSISQSSLAGLQSNLGRMARIQEQLSSGRTINRPSDSPTGAVTAMQLRSETTAGAQYSRNAADGEAWLGTIDTALATMLDKVRIASGHVVEGLNTGANSPASREALAADIDSIRAGLLDDANANYLGRPVFGGVTSGSLAYNTATGAYVGTASPPAGSLAPPAVVRSVGPRTDVRADLTGPEVFETVTLGRNLFTVLGEIAVSLRNDSIGLAPLGAELKTVEAKMREGWTDVGTRVVRMAGARQLANDAVLSLTNSLAEVESTDLPSAIVDMKMSEMSYQAALAATSRAVQPSLIDWLR